MRKTCGKKSTERWNTGQDGIVYEMGIYGYGREMVAVMAKMAWCNPWRAAAAKSEIGSMTTGPSLILDSVHHSIR